MSGVGWGGVFLERKQFSAPELCQMFRGPDLDELLLWRVTAVSFPWYVVGRDEILLYTCMVYKHYEISLMV